MTADRFNILLRAVAAALLMASLAACSSAPGRTQTASSEEHIRSWADWATIPGNVAPEEALISNQSGQGN
jgi:hypothetical protein